MTHWIREYWLRLKRSIQYAIVGWGNHDWDYAYIDHLLLVKLKRVFNCLSNSSILDLEYESNKRPIKALKLAIKLLERIRRDEYCSKEWEVAHTKDASARWNIMVKEQRLKERDRKIFYSILLKYQTCWWE